MRTYLRMICPVCCQEISIAGAGKVKHYRKHVKEGTMFEEKQIDAKGKTHLSFSWLEKEEKETQQERQKNGYSRN